MDGIVTGRVFEAESGRGIGGLNVRVYDKDLLHDDLLGTAATDDDGAFEIAYSERDYRELFDKRPDVYVAVFAPPGRFLADTSDRPIADAGATAHVEVAIGRDVLGDVAPDAPDDVVAISAQIDPEDVRIEPRGAYSRITIPRMAAGGTPGAPALPERRHYVVLPRGGTVTAIEVDEGEPVLLEGAGLPLPVQAPTPDVGVEAEYGDGVTIDDVAVEFTEPDPALYGGDEPYPRQLVEVLRTEDAGPVQMAAIRVSPVRYDPASGRTLLYPDLRYEVQFDRKAAELLAERDERKVALIGELRAELLRDLLTADAVFQAKDIFVGPWLVVQEDAPHLIITDDYRWPESVAGPDGTTRAPAIAERGSALAGSMVAEFERLAEWRTARGTRSRVVTVSQILDGSMGDFTRGGFTRDLAEVIRNFIKHAYANLDTVFVLIGGDLDVVPMRRLVGASLYKTIGCGRVSDNPPAIRRCRVLGSVVKVHPQFVPQPGDPLSTYHGGLRIPFDRQAGSGRLGWYYTNQADFDAKNAGFTRLAAGDTSRYVIVEGPAAVLDDDYYWVRDVNAIPSDLYYSNGLGYHRTGFHDFDDNNNGLYGQSHHQGGSEHSLDSVDYWPDVWVGRASVETAAEAKGFVDKVIAYESLQTAQGAAIDATYLQKVLYAADWWGRKVLNRQTDTSIPPAEKRFTHAGGTTSKLHNDFDLVMTAGTPDRRLVAQTATAQIVIPYDTGASATSLGWFFTTSDSYATQAASPTRFVKVRGPAASIDPAHFFWDPIGLELAASEKETLRAANDSSYPDFTSVQRHYADHFDLSAPPPIVPLDSTTLRNALDAGPHIVSLSGHGWSGGCCGINTSSQPDFTNTGEYFIAYADSCSTARPDGVDSAAEVSLKDPDGGAVAYVGNTRYSWIGIGDNYERFFWTKLALAGRAGIAAGLRLAEGTVDMTWARYAQNLFGDPEMEVWTRSPQSQQVDHPTSVAWGGTITVTVRKSGVPVANHRVTLLGGWTSSGAKPRVYSSKTTQSAGTVSFQLPSSGSPLSEVRLTVTRWNHVPYSTLISVTP